VSLWVRGGVLVVRLCGNNRWCLGVFFFAPPGCCFPFSSKALRPSFLVSLGLLPDSPNPRKIFGLMSRVISYLTVSIDFFHPLFT